MTPRALAVLCMVSMTAAAQDGGVPLIPREVLFGNPERANPLLSPDAKWLGWCAPDAKNVLQVWVQPLGSSTAPEQLTHDASRGIRHWGWTEDSQAIFWLQDQAGDENFHLFLLNLGSRTVRDLTPWEGVRAGFLASSFKKPTELLVTANVRDRRFMDVYRVDLTTGATVLDTQNPGDVDRWYVDAAFQVRGAVASTAEGGTEIRTRETVKSPWKPLVTVGLEENVELIDFTEDGKAVWLASSINADTTRLVEKSLKSGAERLLASSETSDLWNTLGAPRRRTLRAASFDVDGRFDWQAVEPSFKPELDALKAAIHGEIEVTSMDGADTKWIVVENRDQGPRRYFLWDRKAKKAELLFSARPKLDGQPLVAMKPMTLTARDGLPLPAYLSLPLGKAPKNLPLVLLVHGGPWARDTWGYDSTTQWLANRGYAVLRVNFRASSGFGKKFLNAGNRQWGLQMQDDLTDAVNALVQQGIADPKKVAIVGGSYGGYATLAGLTLTPELYACGVDIVGPSNLFTLLDTIPPYWAAFKQQMFRRMGDPSNPADKDLLTHASPLFSASKIKVPLLIGQGANDPRVKQAEAEQIVAAMEKNGLPVTYVLYPDEGHGFARAENATDFNARTEVFLSRCLGGRAEPLPKEGKVAGSTAQVKVVAGKK